MFAVTVTSNPETAVAKLSRLHSKDWFVWSSWKAASILVPVGTSRVMSAVGVLVRRPSISDAAVATVPVVLELVEACRLVTTVLVRTSPAK